MRHQYENRNAIYTWKKYRNGEENANFGGECTVDVADKLPKRLVAEVINIAILSIIQVHQ